MFDQKWAWLCTKFFGALRVPRCGTPLLGLALTWWANQHRVWEIATKMNYKVEYILVGNMRFTEFPLILTIFQFQERE